MNLIASFTSRGSDVSFFQPRVLYRLFMAETIGTFLLIFVGNGAVASAVLVSGMNGPSNYLSASLGYACALIVGINLTGTISGAHVNPAVSLAQFTRCRIEFRTFCLYAVAQYLGAFLASALLYAIYANQIWEFEKHHNNITDNDQELVLTLKTAAIFATYPQPSSSIITCFFDQVVSTAILLFCIEGIVDSRGNVPSQAQPYAIGVCLLSLLLAFGYNCGAALNPARDLSPRLWTALIGWGWQVFSTRNYLWFWVPVVGTHLGGIIGIWVYAFTLGNILEPMPTNDKNSNAQKSNPAMSINTLQVNLDQIKPNSWQLHDLELSTHL